MKLLVSVVSVVNVLKLRIFTTQSLVIMDYVIGHKEKMRSKSIQKRQFSKNGIFPSKMGQFG